MKRVVLIAALLASSPAVAFEADMPPARESGWTNYGTVRVWRPTPAPPAPIIVTPPPAAAPTVIVVTPPEVVTPTYVQPPLFVPHYYGRHYHPRPRHGH